MNVCQLGKGYILQKEYNAFKVTYTGYPYPSIDLMNGAIDQIENLGIILIERNVSVVGYIFETESYRGRELRSLNWYRNIHLYICEYILKGVETGVLKLDTLFDIVDFLGGKIKKMYKLGVIEEDCEDFRWYLDDDVCLLVSKKFIGDKHDVIKDNYEFCLFAARTKQDLLCYLELNNNSIGKENTNIKDILGDSYYKEVEGKLRELAFGVLYNNHRIGEYQHFGRYAHGGMLEGDISDICSLKGIIEKGVKALKFENMPDRYKRLKKIIDECLFSTFYSSSTNEYVVDEEALNKLPKLTSNFFDTILINKMLCISDYLLLRNKILSFKPFINKCGIGIKITSKYCELNEELLKIIFNVKEKYYYELDKIVLYTDVSKNIEGDTLWLIKGDTELFKYSKQEDREKLLSSVCKVLSITNKKYNQKKKIIIEPNIEVSNKILKTLFNCDYGVANVVKYRLMNQDKKDSQFFDDECFGLYTTLEFISLYDFRVDNTIKILLNRYFNSLLSILACKNLISVDIIGNESIQVKLEVGYLFKGLTNNHEDIEKWVEFFINRYKKDLGYLASNHSSASLDYLTKSILGNSLEVDEYNYYNRGKGIYEVPYGFRENKDKDLDVEMEEVEFYLTLN